MDIRRALPGLLVEKRIPFIEVGAGGSIEWLMSESKDPIAFQASAKHSMVLRLSLGDRSSPECFQWKSDYEDFTKRAPVRPGTCLIAVFANELLSNLRVEVNATKVSSRELRWEVVDQATNRVYLSVPFWESQVEGRPLRVVPYYGGRSETYPVEKVIKKLRPVGPADQMNAKSNPYVLNWLKDMDTFREGSLSKANVTGEFRSTQLEWDVPDPRASSESWESGYERAYLAEKPVLLNNSTLIFPSTNLVGAACANPLRHRCDFAKQFLSELGVITTTSDPAYKDTYSKGGASSREMRVNIAARSFEGDVFWNFSVTPQSLPEQVQVCSDFSNRCEFSVRGIRVTDNDVVIFGHFWGNANVAESLRNHDFELVVRRAEIPAAMLAPQR